jgi:hypothetical protein
MAVVVWIRLHGAGPDLIALDFIFVFGPGPYSFANEFQGEFFP